MRIAWNKIGSRTFVTCQDFIFPNDIGGGKPLLLLIRAKREILGNNLAVVGVVRQWARRLVL